MQSVHSRHQFQIFRRDGGRSVIHYRVSNVEHFSSPADRQLVGRVNRLFPLNSPVSLSAPSKISFSSVSCPILARTAVMSVAGVEPGLSPLKMSVAPLSKSAFHWTICVAWTSNCWARTPRAAPPGSGSWRFCIRGMDIAGFRYSWVGKASPCARPTLTVSRVCHNCRSNESVRGGVLQPVGRDRLHLTTRIRCHPHQSPSLEIVGTTKRTGHPKKHPILLDGLVMPQ